MVQILQLTPWFFQFAGMDSQEIAELIALEQYELQQRCQQQQQQQTFLDGMSGVGMDASIGGPFSSGAPMPSSFAGMSPNLTGQV